MDALNKKRGQHERAAGRTLGLPMQFERVWGKQTALMGQEAALHRLPVSVPAIQNELLDEATGLPHFMFGMDPFYPGSTEQAAFVANTPTAPWDGR